MLECDNIYKASGTKTIHGKHCHSFCYMTWRSTQPRILLFLDCITWIQRPKGRDWNLLPFLSSAPGWGLHLLQWWFRWKSLGSNWNTPLWKEKLFLFKKDASYFSLLSLRRVWSIQFTDCKNLGWFNALDLFSSLYHLLKIRNSLLFCPRLRLNHNWVECSMHFSLFC